MERSNDASPSGRWNTLEMVKAFYGPEDCVNDIAEIKFDRPVPIKVSATHTHTDRFTRSTALID